MFNRYVLILKRPFIWLKRFPYRCGYGVHSPFAFNLITQVIYEKMPYYNYEALRQEVLTKLPHHAKGWNDSSIKINRLLFRLVNRFQPSTIVDLGPESSSALYMKSANKKATLYSIDRPVSDLPQVDFLYIHMRNNPQFLCDDFDSLVRKMSPNGICVVKGIHNSKAMNLCWQSFVKNEYVGITFDLYDVGLLFFDKTKIKQDRKSVV